MNHSAGYRILNSDEELFDFLLKTDKDVILIYFGKKFNFSQNFNQKVIKDFIDKYTGKVEILFIKSCEELENDWRYQFIKHDPPNDTDSEEKQKFLAFFESIDNCLAEKLE